VDHLTILPVTTITQKSPTFLGYGRDGFDRWIISPCLNRHRITNEIAPTKPPRNVVSGRCLKVGPRTIIIATVERERKSEIAIEEKRSKQRETV
jgi:hypothetical protein